MRKMVVACTAFLGGALLSACGSDEDPTPVAVALTQESGGGELTVSAPDSIEAGVVEFRFQNQAEGPARAELIGIEGTHTADELIAVFQAEGEPLPPWIRTSPGGVGTTPPGQTATATIKLDKGSYILISSVDSEGDEGPAPASKPVTVTGDGGGSVPGADSTIAAKDYAFEVGELKGGANEIRFENDGKQFHHIQAFPIAQGSEIGDVSTFFQTDGESAGPPPLDFSGGAGTATIGPGDALVTTLDLKPGKYAFVCFVSDREGGAPHFQKGMLQEVTVAA